MQEPSDVITVPERGRRGRPLSALTETWRRAEDRLGKILNEKPHVAIAVIVGCFAVAWTLIYMLADMGSDLHPDTLEAWSYGRMRTWGMQKHPPLMSWVAHTWCLVFPVRDWSFELLAAVTGAIGILFVDLTSRRLLSGAQRVLVTLTLMLLPAYQFMAHKFNANSILLPLWPLATCCFLRSFESRRAIWAIFFGAACALAMLGKYYSAVLLLGFGAAALADPRRLSYLRSWAPWISLTTFVVCLLPHLFWLVENDFKPVKYASSVHIGGDTISSLRDSAVFIAGNLAYLILPVIVLFFARDSVDNDTSRARRADDVFPLLVIFLALLAIPAVLAVVLQSNLPPLWNLPGLFVGVLLLVQHPFFQSSPRKIARLALIIGIAHLVALVLAPSYAFYRNKVGYSEHRNMLRDVATKIDDQYRQLADRPIYAVSGDPDLALGVSFYGTGKPIYARMLPGEEDWRFPGPETAKRGWVGVCFAGDTSCTAWLDDIQSVNPGAVRRSFDAHSSLFGKTGTAAAIAVLMIPAAAP